MQKILVAGNWKMNGTKASLSALMRSLVSECNQPNLSSVQFVVFPPFTYLDLAEKILSGSSMAWGAQDLSSRPANGAFTGQISGEMLKDFSCQFVLVGHSERRHLLHESNQEVAQKFFTALKWDLTPILCVGETEAEREKKQTMAVIGQQLDTVFASPNFAKDLKELIIAYEPVWAIGTGKTATPEQAQEVHAAIRQQIKKYDNKLASTTRIIYGGSVNKANAKIICQTPEINGVLVGGASLEAQQFIEIGKLCSPSF